MGEEVGRGHINNLQVFMWIELVLETINLESFQLNVVCDFFFLVLRKKVDGQIRSYWNFASGYHGREMRQNN